MKGIYCLANDNVLDWMLAFLNSLRTYNSNLPLIVIPFDQNTQTLEKLASQYHFEFLQDESLEDLDKIGSSIHPGKYSDSHMFRKLAAFWGPLEHFIFLDSDIVLLSNPEELLNAYVNSECDLMHYDTSVQYVYKPGEFREEMIRQFHSTGFNTGCFASSKGKLKLEDIRAIVPKALIIKDNFACGGEQPFLNYCIDLNRFKKGTFFDYTTDLCKWTWANQKPVQLVEGAYRLMQPNNPNFNKRLPFLHWSGILSSPVMPNSNLFLKYRLKPLSWFERVKYLCFEWWQPGIRAIAKKIRRKKGMV